MASIRSVTRVGEIWEREIRRVTVSTVAKSMLIILMGLALVYWLWYGLTLRGLHFDEGVSILAAQGILEHGYPQLPSGFIYPRAYLHNYLLAGSLLAFGLNNFSIMVPSLAFGLGSLLLAYRIGADILGKPLLGVAAVALLLFLEIQTWYASSARMYMAFQFFTLLATYSIWRGHILGQGKFKAVAVLAIIAAMLSHREAAVLVVALPTAALVMLRLRGEKWSSIFSVSNIAGVLLIGVAALILLEFRPPSPPAIVIHDGMPPDRQGLNLSLVNWGRHLVHVERMLPYGLMLLPVAYLAAFRGLRLRLDSHRGLIYVLLAFTFCVLTVGFAAKTGVGERFFFFVLPIFALLVCSSAVALVQFFLPRTDPGPQVNRVERTLAVALMLVGGAVSVALGTLQEGGGFSGGSAARYAVNSFSQGPKFMGMAKLGYGIPCGEPGRYCGNKSRQIYEVLREEVQPDDLVISAIPMETHFWLGRVDGYLKQRLVEGDVLTTFDGPTDEYFGTQLIDTVEELRQLRDSGRRVWVVTHSSPVSHISDKVWDVLQDSFTTYQDGAGRIVYINFTQRAVR